MFFISGDNREQFSLKYMSLENFIEKDNPVRVIDAFVDILDLNALGFEKNLPNNTGRPMYNPKDLLKLYIYGYMNRIQSSRNLERETHRNVEVMWLINNLTPDHKTIARFRQSNPRALKNVFKAFVKLGIKAGLYGKELIAVDGTKIQAVNSKERNFTRSKLRDRINRLDQKIERYLEEMESADENDIESDQFNADQTAELITELKERKEYYQDMLQKVTQGEETQISLTDQDSRLMKSKDGTMVAHNIQAAADSKYHMVAEFFVTSQAQDQNMLSVMERKTADILETEHMTFVADMGYNGTSDVALVVMDGHNPIITGTSYEFYIPTMQEEGEELFGDYQHDRARPVYIPEKNVFICQMGQMLKPSSYNKAKHEAKYKSQRLCKQCSKKCTQSRCYVACRYVKQSEFSKEYDDSPIALKKIIINEDKEISKQRKCIIEHIFGSVKRNLALQHLHVRGTKKVEGEMALGFLAYNIKRAINILGTKELIKIIQ